MLTAKSKQCICDNIFGVTAEHCDATTAYLCKYKSRLDQPARFRINSRDVSFEDSVAFAADLITNACAPAIFGFEHLGLANQQACVDLAKMAKAHIALNDKPDGSIWRQGKVTATLGESLDRSDLVVCLGCDPAKKHPRIFKLFQQLNKPVRFLSIGENNQFEISSRCSPLNANQLLEFLALVELSLYNDKHLKVLRQDHLESVRAVAEQLTRANHVSFLYDTDLLILINEFTPVLDQLVSLAKCLHTKTKCVVLDVSNRINELGAENALSWSTGFANAVSFSGPVPIVSNDAELCDVHIHICDENSLPQIKSTAEGILISTSKAPLSSDQFKLIIENMSPFPDDFVRFDDAICELQFAETQGEKINNFLKWIRAVKSQISRKIA